MSSIKYNRNMLFPGSKTEDTSVNNINGWRAYSPSKAARGVSSNPVLNSRYGSHLVAANSNASGPPVVSSGCEITFQEGCDNGQNYLILEWGSSLINPEISTNGSVFAPLGCGATSPLMNNSVVNGDIISVRGVCSIDIAEDGSNACGVTQVSPDTNIYVFYDVTSMAFGTAKDFRDAIENWANNNITDYVGNVYHLPVMHERWALWVQYPITGILPPYYQLNGTAPSDASQYAALWDGATYNPLSPGVNGGPDDNNGDKQRVPWAGPLVTGTGIHTYNNDLPDAQGNVGAGAQILQSTGGSFNMGRYSRPAWDYASNGSTPFFNLPKAGDKIPNFQNTGASHIITLGQAAQLGDIKAGEFLANGGPTTGAAGELDAGGSQARFVGGDMNALVICLSDETVHNNSWEQAGNSNAMPDSELAGAWEGYHGRVSHHAADNAKLTKQIPNPSNTINDTTALAEAKSHYFVQVADKGRRFHWNTINKCQWAVNPSKPYGSAGGNYTQGPAISGASPTSTCSDWCYYIAAYDWTNGIGGTYYDINTGKGLHPLRFRDATHSDFPTNGWYFSVDDSKFEVETFCGESWCPGAGSGEDGYGCDWDLLTQPTPGYIADFKYHIDNVYPIIEDANTATASGCSFSTFFYVVTNDPNNSSRTGNSLCTVAALEGKTLGSFDSTASTLNGAGIATRFPDTNNGGTMPSTAGGDIAIEAVGYFNPYGYEDNSGSPLYWHPNEAMGFDIKNHQYFKPIVGPDSVPGYGFKWYAQGSAGKCGYNVNRGAGVTTQNIIDDLNDFIAGGGTQCNGQDCLVIEFVDDFGDPVVDYNFDFNGIVYTSDAMGSWGTQLNPGIYSFICNNFMINTSPATPGDHTDTQLADPISQSQDYGCNAWRIVVTITSATTVISRNCTLGCTDGTGKNNPVGSSAACNYDPTAGVDDGSCIYADCTDMCPDPSSSFYTPYSLLNTYPIVSTNGFPWAWQNGGGDAYYSPQCPTCCVGGNTGLLPSDCVDCLGVCGGTATYDECGVCDGPGPDDCGICFGDSTCCVGCLDPTAINYDPTATIECDDCCEYINIECKLKELAAMVNKSCPEDCDEEAKELLLEASMLYMSLMMGGVLGKDNDIMKDIEIHNIIRALHRLLAKIECGNCKNC